MVSSAHHSVGRKGSCLGTYQPRRGNQCGHELCGTGQPSGRGTEDRNRPLPFSVTKCQPGDEQTAASEPTDLSSLRWFQSHACCHSQKSRISRARIRFRGPGPHGERVHSAHSVSMEEWGAPALGRLGTPLCLSPCFDLGSLLFSCQNPGPWVRDALLPVFT